MSTDFKHATGGFDSLRERLIAAENQHHQTRSAEPLTLWKVVNSVHSHPSLRARVTLESRSLIPLVVRDVTTESDWLVHVLLAIPSSTPEELKAPWALVTFRWPDGKLVGFEEIDSHVRETLPCISARCLIIEAVAQAIQEATVHHGKAPPPPEPLASVFAALHLTSSSGSKTASKTNRDDAVQRSCSEPKVPAHFSTGTVVRPEFSRLAMLIERVAGLFESDPEGLRLLDLVKRRLSFFGFNVVVAGEGSRGKTTLINSLLGEEVIPIGIELPTVLVSPRNDRALVVRKPGCPPQRLPVEIESWQRIATEREIVQEKTGRSTRDLIELQIPCERLAAGQVHLLEVFGSECDSHATTVLHEALSWADAALIVVSAINAMSRSEREFVQQHVIAREIPRVAVVLTRLDNVTASQATKVVEHVRDVLAELGANIVLGTIRHRNELDGDMKLAFAGPDELATLLQAWASDPAHVDLLGRQARAQLMTIAETARAQNAAEQELLALSETERDVALKGARKAIDHARLDWMDIRNELDRRALDAGDTIGSALAGQKITLTERLAYELRNRPNLKAWWEEDLPFRMREEMTRIGREIEGLIARRIAEDVGWLQQKATKRFGQGVWLNLRNEPGNWRSLSQERKPRTITDVAQTRMFARIGFAGITLVGYLIAGPVGIAVSLASGIISEAVIGHKMTDQKQQLAVALDHVVEATLRETGRLIIKRIKNIYRQLADCVEGEEKHWFESKITAIETVSTAPGKSEALRQREQAWQDILNELQSISLADRSRDQTYAT
jgi:hypothetical protein